MTPAEARRFLENCNGEIELGVTDDLARRILEAHEIVAADIEARREAELAAVRAALAIGRGAGKYSSRDGEFPAPPPPDGYGSEPPASAPVGFAEDAAAFQAVAEALGLKNPAPAPGDDAELLALLAKYAEADAEAEALWALIYQAEAALTAEVPEPARVRDSDVGLQGFGVMPPVGDFYGRPWLVARREYMNWVRSRDRNPPDWDFAVARFDEIERGTAEYFAEIERLTAKSQIPEIRGRLEILVAAMRELRMRICAARAATRAGIIGKMRLVAAHRREEIETELAEALASGEASEDEVLDSALRDALCLPGTEAPAGAQGRALGVSPEK